jgi:formate C-acetyltransferase
MANFKQGKWQKELDVRNFVHLNYTQYNGDESFLAPVTARTLKIWEQILILLKKEQKKGILDLDVDTPSSILSHKPGYIDKRNEVIVGIQTETSLKRTIKPAGGIKLVERAAESYGYKIPKKIVEIYTKYRKTHNDGVFSVYSEKHKLLRRKHILTGLPDNYSRGRIIGDYRRIPLYGVDRLIEFKNADLQTLSKYMTEENIQLREETFEQIKALEEIKEMAKMYGFDISKPAKDSKEAIQWMYFGYLAAVKQQDGAAMSIGRLDTFLDVFIEEDLKSGKYNESQIQEMIDDFVIKLRIVRHLRTPEYDKLFAGDPTWVTMVLGGTDLTGRHFITKTAYRFLHTLTNLGPAPEPNLTVLWSKNLPRSWKRYCAKQSVISSSIQYENDELMKPYYGDDYGISCCVSGMAIGKEMQFFGARCNLAKALLLAINGGKEEAITHESEYKTLGGDRIIENFDKLKKQEYLDYDEVWEKFMSTIDWIAKEYVTLMNVIHYMHDKYYYESEQMALHDLHVKRNMAFGLAGLSVVTDALSAIKNTKVRPVWNKNGVASKYILDGDYPKFGNDDDNVDQIAVEVVKAFMTALKKYPTYRKSNHVLSILTITANVVYGYGTGATPDGRKSGEPFAPGANPMHGRDSNGAIASLNSVAKLPYEYAVDGISNTFSITPTSLGKTQKEQDENLVSLLDGYFMGKGGHHLNVNVLTKDTLLDAQKRPEKYPQLTIRVSGYAVLFNKLSKEQQNEVISRTFHNKM